MVEITAMKVFLYHFLPACHFYPHCNHILRVLRTSYLGTGQFPRFTPYWFCRWTVLIRDVFHLFPLKKSIDVSPNPSSTEGVLGIFSKSADRAPSRKYGTDFDLFIVNWKNQKIFLLNTFCGVMTKYLNEIF